MNENCKRIIVSSKVAELLKKLGFNWACEFYYTDNKFSYYDPNRIILMKGERETNWNADEFTMFVRNKPRKVLNGTYYDDFREKNITRLFYSAPTLDGAQRWLREEKGIDIEIRALVGMLHVKAYVPYISIYKPYELSDEDKAAGITVEDVIKNNLVSQKQLPITYKDDNQLITAHASFYTYEDAQRAVIDKAINLLIDKDEFTTSFRVS